MSIAAGCNHQQQQQQQPEQAEPQLLLGLPAPAVRRILRLASTPCIPGVCQVSRVSKALRVGADAAAAPIHLTVDPCRFAATWSDQDFVLAKHKADARCASLRSWLHCHGRCVRSLRIAASRQAGFTVVPKVIWYRWDDQASSAQVAAGTTDGDHVSQDEAIAAAAAGTAGEVGAGMVSDEAACVALPEVRLEHLGLYFLNSSMACFKQLQVLVLKGSFGAPWGKDDSGQLLRQVLSSLTQLQRLALHTFFVEDHDTADGLLLSLPPSLRALDLTITCSNPCRSSSLAHLVHLTSLQLQPLSIEGDWHCSEQQQAEPQGVDDSPAQVIQQQQQQQQNQQQKPGPLPVLRALSIRPLLESCWFAGPLLEEVELIMYLEEASSLVQLAGSQRLRRVIVTYYQVPERTGVSKLTQLTHLRLEFCVVSRTSSSLPPLGAELGALEQLQVLEVSYWSVQAMQPHKWLPRLRSLTRLVALGVDATNLEPLHQLATVIAEWHSSSSCSSDCGRSSSQADSTSTARAGAVLTTPSTFSSSSSSGCKLEGRALPAIAACTLQHLVLITSHFDNVLTRMRHAEALPKLQQVAAGIMAANPWLQVVVTNTDTYTCPCWLGDNGELGDDEL